jgi:hypothetical protein
MVIFIQTRDKVEVFREGPKILKKFAPSFDLISSDFKTERKISSNFVAFSKHINFKILGEMILKAFRIMLRI